MPSAEISDFARELLRTDSLKVDKVLQEVRVALTLLATKCYASYKDEFCWCARPTGATRPEGDNHDTTCQHVRQLMTRLRIEDLRTLRQAEEGRNYMRMFTDTNVGDD
jgi:hypothetical protein